MKNLLENEIPELERKIDKIMDESESAQLRLIVHSCRAMLKDGDFISADDILHIVAQRIEYLHERKTLKS